MAEKEVSFGAAPLALARYAMGTRFEMLLAGAPEPVLRAAGEEALDEIENLDRTLSLFRTDSLLAHINRTAFERPVRLDGVLFAFFETCLDLGRRSKGAFDITAGPLMRSWGFRGATDEDAPAEDSSSDAVLSRVGIDKIALDRKARTLRLLAPGMELDLGAAAKGFALDAARRVIEEAGVESALLHGGCSIMLALDPPPGQSAWGIGVPDPLQKGRLLGRVWLRRKALSLSAPHGRTREIMREGRAVPERAGHIMDPATGLPARAACLAAAAADSALDADAWSTAFLVGGPGRFEELVHGAEGVFGFLYWESSAGPRTAASGPDKDRFFESLGTLAETG